MASGLRVGVRATELLLASASSPPLFSPLRPHLGSGVVGSLFVLGRGVYAGVLASLVASPILSAMIIGAENH